MRFAVLACVLVPSVAAAHITLTYPPARTPEQKQRHCGLAGSTRGSNVTTLEPGSTITVRWRETVDHPGHYRISFDTDGEDFLIPPTDTESTEGLDPTVIADLIPDVGGPIPSGGRPYSFQITLPDVECDNCTLQLIQMMTESAVYDPDVDIYFQCADITLQRTGGPTPDAGMGGGDDAGPVNTDGGTTGAVDPGNIRGGEGCHATGGATGLLLALAPLGLALRRRRS